MVGSSIFNTFKNNGFNNLLTIDKSKLDLTEPKKVDTFFKYHKPEIVIIAAAKVGGILANNTYKSEFINENILISFNLINSSKKFKVKKLIYLGSSCIYPKKSKQPIIEESLLTSSLEPTNEPYAIAKIAGLKYCTYLSDQFNLDFRALMPTNLYGPNDNFNLYNSHVIPAMIRKFYEAKIQNKKKVVLWGTGKPTREFMHVDDLSQSIIAVLKLKKDKWRSLTKGVGFLNIGTGNEISMKKLSEIINKNIGFKGRVIFDISKPDGTPRKSLSGKRFKKLKVKINYNINKGIKDTIFWYSDNFKNARS